MEADDYLPVNRELPACCSYVRRLRFRQTAHSQASGIRIGIYKYVGGDGPKSRTLTDAIQCSYPR